jgi:hypothetical protein
MRYLLLVFFCLNGYASFAQDSLYTKTRIIGTFHARDTKINGISAGFISTMDDKRNVKSNGLRLEVPGLGLVSFMGNGFPNAKEPFSLQDYKFSEVVNGLNISSGSWCDCNYNGLTIAVVGQYGKLGNGLSLAGGWNIIDSQHGVQIALLANTSYYMDGVQISAFNNTHVGNGLQIGLRNEAKDFKGIQIGLWNVNQKRKLPFVNWNFK